MNNPEEKDNIASVDESIQAVKAEEKIKKNLLWFGIFSIIMLFAGITSGYIVARDSSFWVKLTLPDFFLWSTISIILSSLLLYIAAMLIKKGNNKGAAGAVGFALFLGLFFGYTQYQGFMDLSKKGSAINAKIVNLEGRYGEYFTLFKEGKELTFDGDHFYHMGNELSEADLNELKTFLKQFLNIQNEEARGVSDYGKYIFQYKGVPVTYLNDRLEYENLSLSPLQKRRLYFFSEAIISERGDFYMIGEYGKDFSINYMGKPVEYKNRKFYRDGQELSPLAYSELGDSNNKASSFILAFVVIHGLHWFAGIIALLVMAVNASRNKYTAMKYTGLKVGSMYWHFLGILWLYLYVFLNFIH